MLEASKLQEPLPTPAIAKYSISSLASSIYYNCEKHIYLLSKPEKKINNNSSDDNKIKDESIKEAHCVRGNEFEEKLFERHRSIMVDHSDTKDFKEALTKAEPGKYLYQLKCSLPESFYKDIIHNTTSYRINNFIPDFLYIRQDPVTNMRKIFIIDAKASKKMSNSHQFQVSSYAFFLSYLITDIHNLEVDDMGGVWLPSNMDAPEQFRIDFVLNKIKYMYIDTLVKISLDPNPEWVLGNKCVSCPFLKRCKSDAVGTVRSIPYMNEEKAKQLKNSSTIDIEDLSELLNTLRIDEAENIATEQSPRALTGYEDYVNAYNDHQPRFMGYASVYTAQKIDHAIYVFLQTDNYSQRPFVYGIQVIDVQNNKKVSEYYFNADYQEHLQDELVVYSRFAEKFVTDLTKTLHYADQQNSRCLFYVYDGQEKKQIQRYLYDIIISGNDDLVNLQEDEKKRVISNAMQCLVVLFQDTQLLGLPGIVQFPDMDDLPKTSSVGRFTSIEELLQQNIALGVSGYYGLSDAVEWMTSSNQNEGEELRKALSGLDLNEIYTHWKTPGNDIACATELLVSKRFTWLQEIMSTYWRLAVEYMNTTKTELFPLTCKPFKWPILKKFNNQTLAKLVFFKQLECIKSCDEVRMDRIRDLSKLEHHININEATLGGLVLEYEYGVGSDFDYDHTFSVSPLLNGPHVQQKMDSLKMDTFKQYILVPDDRDGIIETIVYPDLQYKTAGTQSKSKTLDLGTFQKKNIRCIDIKAIRANQIVVNSYNLKKSVKRWRLYKRFTDHTVDRCTETLKNLDKDEDEEGLTDVMELIKDPNAWSIKNPLNDDSINFNSNIEAQELLDDFAMSPSQKDISASIFKRRLQIIWGPPGSGKTEFLALFINWYIKCFSDQHTNKGKDLMIGVTAFTRDAIVNLLKRIEKVQRNHGLSNLFSIMYVNSGEALKDSDIMCVEWKDSIKNINKLKKSTSINIYVVGATVWGWNRIRNNWKRFKQKGCDIMILDESTQLLVSDAILAIACLSKPCGKLIVAGDHMQLGPIIKNNYSDIPSSTDDPLLYGSIQQCLMRTSENHAIPAREFLLQVGALHDFGPNTLQLKDNWRMNDELNSFFQQIYGPDYTSRFPEARLQLDWTKPQQHNHANLIQAILDPSKSISLVKLQQSNQLNAVENEANIVQQLVSAYLDTKKTNEPSVMIVTPHHQQRIAIKRKLEMLSNCIIPVDTVEKMQGQECELIIACFSCTNNKRSRNNEFLRDFRRWNVALSRARTKVIVLTVEELLNPNPTEGILESFHQPFEPTDGYALLCLLQAWAKKKESIWTI